MRHAPHLGEIHLHRAGPAHGETGILGWITMQLDSVQLDGVALRRTRDGALTLSFPERRDKAGQRHPIVRPLGRAERQEIEALVIARLRARGDLA
jgi:hypothetical protein